MESWGLHWQPLNTAACYFGIGDEAVESTPCHGEVSRCESGRSRHFAVSQNVAPEGPYVAPTEVMGPMA